LSVNFATFLKRRWFLGILATLLAAQSAAAVDITGVLPGSLAQPQVHGLLQPAGGGDPYTDELFTGSFDVIGYLDTGSSGVVISDFTAFLLDLPTQPGVTFEDVAAGGTTEFEVSVPVNLRINSTNNPDVNNLGTYEAVYDKVYGPLRTQVGPVDSVFDVYGMPVMLGKHVVIDPTQSDPVLLLSAPAYIYEPGTPFNPATVDTNPGIPTTSHHVQLSYGDFTPYTRLTPANAEGPVQAHNPFLGPSPTSGAPDDSPPVTLTFGDRQTSGSFLLDTGGGASFLSSDRAADLGVRLVDPFDLENPQLERFDPDNPGLPGTLIENQFQLQLQGVDGEPFSIAGFYLDMMVVETIEGSSDLNDPNNIRYISAPFLINDITVEDAEGMTLTLDGVFGINFLLDSVLAEGLDITEQASPFRWVTFDEPNGVLGLDLGLVPEPSSIVLAGCGLLALSGYAWRRRATWRRWRAAGQSPGKAGG
jgi:hypothetical protein